MNAWQHKHTREIRSQSFSPGDDWELIVATTALDFTLIFIAASVVIYWIFK